MRKAKVKEGDLKMNTSSTGRGWGHFYQVTSEALASSASACAANRSQMHERVYVGRHCCVCRIIKARNEKRVIWQLKNFLPLSVALARSESLIFFQQNLQTWPQKSSHYEAKHSHHTLPLKLIYHVSAPCLLDLLVLNSLCVLFSTATF